MTGAAATIQQCIGLFQFIQSATNTRKHLRDFINQYCKEITRTGGLIEVVRKEKALQIPDIIFALKDVHEAGKKLNARLHSAEKGLRKSNIRLIGNALLPDPEEERELQAELRELELAKRNLDSHILLYLARGISNSIDVQTASIDKLDHKIKGVLPTGEPVQIQIMSELGEERGISWSQIQLQTRNNSISTADATFTEEMDGDLMDTDQQDQSDTCKSTATASFPKGSTKVRGSQRASRKEVPSEDRNQEHEVLDAFKHPLNDSSSSTFSSTASSAISSTALSISRATKIIKRNRAKSESMVFNAPVSEVDDWKGDNVTIKRNVAGKGSTMFNYPNPQEFLLEVTRIRSNREPLPSKRSFLSRK